MVRNLIEDLGTIREEADRTLQYLSKDTAYRLAEFNTITVGTNTFIRSFNEHIQFLEDNCNSLLSRYRNVNSLNRTTPPPDYFSQEWRAPCDLPNEPLTAETQSLLTNAQQALKEIQDSAGMTSRRLLRAFRDSIKEFKGLDDLSAQVLEGITNA